jgi:hypothetical protein
MLLVAPFLHQPPSLVFTFHSVGQEDPSRDDIRGDHSYEVFVSFLKWLKTNTEVVPVAQTVSPDDNRLRASSEKIQVALSFDDAHLDNYRTLGFAGPEEWNDAPDGSGSGRGRDYDRRTFGHTSAPNDFEAA